MIAVERSSATCSPWHSVVRKPLFPPGNPPLTRFPSVIWTLAPALPLVCAMGRGMRSTSTTIAGTPALAGAWGATS